MALRWGLSLSLSGELAQPSLVADAGAAAEAAGWDGIFVWDHLWNRTGEPFADPWVTLAAVAIATERLRLGPLVTPLPRRRPQVVAQHAATLDRLSSGRVILGLGLGHDKYGEYSAFAEPHSSAVERAQALDSGIGYLRQALTGGPVSSAGERPVSPSCVQKPRCPIWVAGRQGNPAGPRRARRHDLEGVALVGVDEWTPVHVTEALAMGGFEPGAIEVALVGGTHSRPGALGEAGATWAIPEVLPGTSGADALARANRNPGHQTGR